MSDCLFLDCKTERDGEIIVNRYDTYYSAFKKEKTGIAVDVYNCRGLDQVNRSCQETYDTARKEKTSTGEVVGMTLAIASVGAPVAIGGAIAYNAIKATCRDDNIIEE